MANAADPDGPIAFSAMRERVSQCAKAVVAAAQADAGPDDAEFVRAAGNAVWTVGMVAVGVYQELNEIKHELRAINQRGAQDEGD